MKVSVVVPTYRRPEMLRRCVQSLVLQDRRPDEVIIVTREEGDPDSVQAVRDLARYCDGSFPVVHATVREPGHLPPIRTGFASATGDIVCVMDDDAEAFPDWIARLMPHYARGDVGGVGGAVPHYGDGGRIDHGVARRIGKVLWNGRVVGDYYREIPFPEARDVDFFMGCNMSYRRDVLGRVEIDPQLNRGVAYNYEVDLGLQVRKLGYRLVFDPSARVRHYAAPVSMGGVDHKGSSEVRCAVHNTAYILLKRLGTARRALFLAYSFLVGSRISPGIAVLLIALAGGRREVLGNVIPAVRGVLEGFRSYRRWSRGGAGGRCAGAGRPGLRR